MSEKRIVFLLHGMGNHTKGWSDVFIEQLQTEARKYANLHSISIRDEIDFQELSYGHIFSDALAAWSDTANGLISNSPALEAEMIEKAVGWLTGIKDVDDNFGWTHAADVLLWKVSPFFSNTVKTEVAHKLVDKILKALKASPSRSVKASVVSHSLGTSVAHDTLSDIANGAFRGNSDDFGFRPEFFRFESFHSFANVSLLLERTKYPVYSGPVQPGTNGDSNSYCNHFYNYRNKFDPFTRSKPFEPDWDVRWFHDKQCSHLYDKNPHGMEHYVRNPIVHVPLLRSLLGDFDVIGSTEELNAVTGFSPIGQGITKKIQSEIHKRVEDASSQMGSSTDIIDIMKGAAVYFA